MSTHQIDRPGPRSITDAERPFLGLSLRERRQLRERLRDHGVSPRKVKGLMAWLEEKSDGELDTTGPNTRADYRKILAELQLIDPSGPEGGWSTINAIAGIAAGTAMVLSGRADLAGPALHALQPIILDQPVMSGEERRAA